MRIVADCEDAIISRVERLLEGRVRNVETAPPDWDIEFLKRVLKRLPGVFVVFDGAHRVPGSACVVDTRWSIVAVTAHAQGAKVRARGDALQIGCYNILEILAPAFHGQPLFRAGEKPPLPPLGTLEFESWETDASLKLENFSVMIQSATFGMRLELVSTLDPSALVPFKRFDADYNTGALAQASETSDTVIYPQ